MKATTVARAEPPARRLARAGASIAMQCAVLSRRGGGLPTAILPLAARLTPHRLCIVTFEPPAESLAIPTVVANRGWWRLGLDAADALREGRVEIVHTHGLWTPLSMAAMTHRRRTGAATIVSPHGMLDSWALSRSPWRKRAALQAFERRHLNGADVVHALNGSEACAIRDAGVRSAIAIIPNGIDPAPPVPSEPPDWMDRPTLLFLGRLHVKKAVSELIAAWSRASGRLSDWQLAIAGWDDGENTFRQEAETAKGRILFPGALFGDDKAAAYAHASAFVLPSYSEGLPMTVLEAWSYGLPVLMTEACNLPQGFSEGAAERITTDPSEMAEALVTKLRDATWRAEAGASGRRLAAGYSWEAVSSAWRELYDYTLGRGNQPACIYA